MSNIAGYNLAQEKVIYSWVVQTLQRLRRGRAIKAEKEKKKQLAMEAGLASHAHSSLKLCLVLREEGSSRSGVEL